MQRVVKKNQFDKDFIKKAYIPSSMRESGNMNISNDLADINVKYLNTGKGISYSFIEGKFNQNIMLDGYNDYDISIPFLHFNTAESILVKDEDLNESFEFQSDNYWLGTNKKNNRLFAYYDKEKVYTSHYITFEPNIFKEFVSESSEFANIKPILEKKDFELKQTRCINIYQKKVLKELSDIKNFDNTREQLKVESKLLDLLYITLDELDSTPQEKNVYLGSDDLKSLQRAKKILLENMQNPPSIKDLAYKSAINEFKLKKGFKKFFGNTVYGVLQEYRLLEAKRLLEEEELNIGEVALEVGYKNVGHFTKIFKNRFDINPMEIKQQKRKYYPQ